MVGVQGEARIAVDHHLERLLRFSRAEQTLTCIHNSTDARYYLNRESIVKHE